MSELLDAIGFGLVSAAILALAAVGLSLQMSVARIPNFAHGEIMTAGAYAAYLASSFTSNIVIEGAAAALAGGVVAFLMNALLLGPFSKRRPKLLILFILTIASSLILQNIMLGIFGGASLGYHLALSVPLNIGPFLLSAQNLVTIAAAVVLMLGVHVVLKYTKFGKAQRAVSDSRELARVAGINSDQIVRLTWLMDGLITGVGGFALAVSVGSITPTLGQDYLLVIFAAVILGGIGKPYGAMAGALVIGLAISVSGVYIAGGYTEVVAFLLMILALLFRPSGIFSSPRAAVQPL